MVWCVREVTYWQEINCMPERKESNIHFYFRELRVDSM